MTGRRMVFLRRMGILAGPRCRFLKGWRGGLAGGLLVRGIDGRDGESESRARGWIIGCLMGVGMEIYKYQNQIPIIILI
jgi:hypothetical protein